MQIKTVRLTKIEKIDHLLWREYKEQTLNYLDDESVYYVDGIWQNESENCTYILSNNSSTRIYPMEIVTKEWRNIDFNPSVTAESWKEAQNSSGYSFIRVHLPIKFYAAV